MMKGRENGGYTREMQRKYRGIIGEIQVKYRLNTKKLDGVAPLIADPPPMKLHQ